MDPIFRAEVIAEAWTDGTQPPEQLTGDPTAWRNALTTIVDDTVHNLRRHRDTFDGLPVEATEEWRAAKHEYDVKRTATIRFQKRMEARLREVNRLIRSDGDPGRGERFYFRLACRLLELFETEGLHADVDPALHESLDRCLAELASRAA